MRTLILTSSALALTFGMASAEVIVSGDARMGIVSDFDLGGLTIDFVGGETQFHSRARVNFTLSGETDGGLSFGASFRADNADRASGGTSGSVWVSGGFGKLSMGDVDSAAKAAVGHVSGVGLTGLGDLNEVEYFATGDGVIGTDPAALYEYSNGSFTGYLSMTNPGNGETEDSAGVRYATESFSVSIGYENGFFKSDQVILGATAALGPVTAKAVYSQVDFGGPKQDQYAVSLDYAADALTLTGFYLKNLGDVDNYGVGASYDLGGGASVVGGYSMIDLPAPTGAQST
jgi:outer membrane protein OmpU